MTADDVPHIAQYLLKQHGLSQQGWTFRWDHAKRRAGRCSYSRKTITLSRHFAELNVTDRLGEIIDTILHEIAHALAPWHGHDDEWKSVCLKVGARPERCYDSEVVSMPDGEWSATCGGCGRRFSRHRQLRTNKWVYCRRCGPKVGRLTYATGPAAVPVVGRSLPPRKLT